MEMLDTKYAVSSHTFSEMEQLIYDFQDSYFLLHLLYCVLDDMGFTFDFSSYRLNSLDVPFASSSMSRSFELGFSRLFDCIHSLDDKPFVWEIPDRLHNALDFSCDTY